MPDYHYKTSIKRKRASYRTSIPRGNKKTTEELQIVFGKDVETGEPVGLTRKQRKLHTHVIGATGSGKSKFLELMLRHDVRNPKCGVCLIDPHGPLYDATLSFISHRCPELADRVILFNPAGDAHRDHIVGFNPIVSDAENMDYTVKTLISGCLKAWGQDNTMSTPRIARVLKNVFTPLLLNDLTLLEAAPLVTINGDSYRDAVMKKVFNHNIREDWDEFRKLNYGLRKNEIEGAANRFVAFLSNKIIRSVIAQRIHALDFEKIMKEGKILLINLADMNNRLGHEDATLLGTMIVGEVFRASKKRNWKDPSLKPFYFYIDEFGQFVTKDTARGLEELRKFRTFFILAHQTFAQLRNPDENDYLLHSVMTNCQTKIAFGGLSYEDAGMMSNEIMTGYIDFKEVKEELYTTKELHEERDKEVISKTRMKTHGGSSQDNEAEGESLNDGTDQSRSYDPHSGSNSLKIGESQKHSHATNKQKGHAEGRQWNEGESETVQYQKEWAPVRYKELMSRTYYSLTEQQEKALAKVKNNDVAHAYIRIGNAAPQNTKITFVKTIGKSSNAPKAIEEFYLKVIDNHPQYYALRLDAIKEYQQRQYDLFGEVIRFDDEPILIEAKTATIDDLNEDDSDDFNCASQGD